MNQYRLRLYSLSTTDDTDDCRIQPIGTLRSSDLEMLRAVSGMLEPQVSSKLEVKLPYQAGWIDVNAVSVLLNSLTTIEACLNK